MRTDSPITDDNGRGFADRPLGGVTSDERLLWAAAEAAVACGCSLRTWWRLDAAGKVPAPLKLGPSKRWSVEELKRWIEHGCPDRARWDQTLALSRKGGRKGPS